MAFVETVNRLLLAAACATLTKAGFETDLFNGVPFFAATIGSSKYSPPI